MGLTRSPDPPTPAGYTLTRLEHVAELVRKHGINWARRNSLWPMPFATACCGIELMATACSRYDLARFGMEAMRFSPRQCDVLICAGRVVMKMMPVLQRIYLQMPEPKWVVSMGACACTGGVFDTYAVIQGIDQFMPVDVFVPGCPPRPETLLEGLMALQQIVTEQGVRSSRERGRGLRLMAGAPGRAVLGPGLAGTSADPAPPSGEEGRRDRKEAG